MKIVVLDAYVTSAEVVVVGGRDAAESGCYGHIYNRRSGHMSRFFCYHCHCCQLILYVLLLQKHVLLFENLCHYNTGRTVAVCGSG